MKAIVLSPNQKRGHVLEGRGLVENLVAGVGWQGVCGLPHLCRRSPGETQEGRGAHFFLRSTHFKAGKQNKTNGLGRGPVGEPGK